jgi:hypothetical protein
MSHCPPHPSLPLGSFIPRTTTPAAAGVVVVVGGGDCGRLLLTLIHTSTWCTQNKRRGRGVPFCCYSLPFLLFEKDSFSFYSKTPLFCLSKIGARGKGRGRKFQKKGTQPPVPNPKGGGNWARCKGSQQCRHGTKIEKYSNCPFLGSHASSYIY